MPVDTLGRLRARRRVSRPPSRPWTDEEDDKVREIARIGLAHEYWPTALPARTFHEIAERRLELCCKTAPAL